MGKTIKNRSSKDKQSPQNKSKKRINKNMKKKNN